MYGKVFDILICCIKVLCYVNCDSNETINEHSTESTTFSLNTTTLQENQNQSINLGDNQKDDDGDLFHGMY